MTRIEAANLFERYVGNECYTDKFQEACAMALAALREHVSLEKKASDEKQATSDWISVEERLPEPGERVLTTDGAFVGEMYINKRGKWQRYNVNDSSLLMALDILWWMPLPEPPEVDTP